MVRIFWDKGHGGNDTGTVGNGLQEKQLVSRIVNYAMAYMTANYAGFEQRTSRSGDETVSLAQRANMANAWGATIFISCHVNAGGGTGFESYIYNGTVGNATFVLQDAVHAEVLRTMRSFRSTIRDRGQKRANFAVLRQTRMPAVLTESLFIDSAADVQLLRNEQFLRAVGEAHARGAASFLGLNAREL